MLAIYGGWVRYRNAVPEVGFGQIPTLSGKDDPAFFRISAMKSRDAAFVAPGQMLPSSRKGRVLRRRRQRSKKKAVGHAAG